MRHTIHNAHAVDLSHFGQFFSSLAHPRSARRAVRAKARVFRASSPARSLARRPRRACRGSVNEHGR
jgi:hypothetical protein